MWSRGDGLREMNEKEKIAKSAPAMLVCTRGVWDIYKKKCPYEGFIINLKPPLSNLKKLKTQEQKKNRSQFASKDNSTPQGLPLQKCRSTPQGLQLQRHTPRGKCYQSG